jgi:DegV family protein with EDD domain
LTVRIVTDSTCDLPAEVAAELGITVIPCYINAAEGSYQDGVDLTRREFYQRLPDWVVPPTTAAPGVETFFAVYERLAREGASGIISLHPLDKLSNLANVARLAARRVSVIPVQVVPGEFLSMAGGFVAMAAARAAQAGCSLKEILKIIENKVECTHIFAGLSTLEFLRRSGRVSHLGAILGTWFKVFPLLKLHQDAIELEPIRTQTRVMERLVRLVAELGPLEELALAHTNAPDRVLELRRQAAAYFPPDKPILTVEVTPVIGVHIGPGAVGLIAVRAEDRGRV